MWLSGDSGTNFYTEHAHALLRMCNLARFLYTHITHTESQDRNLAVVFHNGRK